MELSIITVNYNNKVGLEKTIQSVMSQTWRDFEWIIIDGGSTDGSAEVITELAKNPQTNISYWCSEKDKGVYNAMNKGIAHTSGKYLNFMNSGDIFFSFDTLEKVFSKEYSADIVYGDWKRLWSDHEDIHSFPYPVEIYRFYKENISHQAMFIKRDFHVNHLYDETYYFFSDYINWCQAALEGATFDYIHEIICIVTMDGISCQGGEQSKLEIKRLRKELWKEPIRLSMENLDRQLNDPYQLRIRTLLGMGGIPKFLTLVFLKVMKKLFLQDLNEEWK